MWWTTSEIKFIKLIDTLYIMKIKQKQREQNHTKKKAYQNYKKSTLSGPAFF